MRHMLLRSHQKISERIILARFATEPCGANLRSEDAALDVDCKFVDEGVGLFRYV